MATVLEVIAPIAHHDPPLGPATARCWNDSRLARHLKDLVAWRSRLEKRPMRLRFRSFGDN